MKNNLRMLLSATMALSIFFFLISCKKENERLVQTAPEIKNKSFYTRIEVKGVQRPKDLIDTIISICKIDDLTSNFSDAVIKKYGYPRWDMTMTLQNQNGLKTLLVPVVDSADRVRLIISAYQQSNDKFLFKMIAKDMQQPGLPKYSKDNKVFTSQSLAGIFNSLEKQVIASKNLSHSPGNDIETNNSNITISWICWTEMWVDENGGFFMTNTKCSYSMIFTSSTFGSIASVPDLPEIGGGGGSSGGGDGINPNPCEAICIEQANKLFSSYPVSEVGTVEVTSLGDFKKVKTMRWKAHESNSSWSIYSTEQGIVKLIDVQNNIWQWESLEHKSMGLNGIVIGGTIEVKNDIGHPSFSSGTQNVYYAAMAIEYDIIATPICDCKFIPAATFHNKNNSSFYPAKP